MESNKEQMFMMHTMCRNELSLLKINLEKFIEESERCQKLLNDLNAIGGGGGFTNIFGLIVFDRYMTQVVTVLNMARKFNIQLEINNLDQTVINASSNGCLDDANFTQTRLLKDFIEWRNSIVQDGAIHDGEVISPKAGRIKMSQHLSEINEDTLPSNDKARMVESLQKHENNSLLNHQKEPQSECITNNSKNKTINDLLDVILPTRSLDLFQKGYNFHAYIVYVGDYKKREFFICQMDDYKTLYDLSSNINFKPIPRESLPTDEVFCVLEIKDTTLRECVWRAVIVPSESTTSKSQKFAYLIDFGEVIPLTDQCTTFEAPLLYREIPPLAIKCILEGVEDTHLNCVIKDQEKCEQALHKNEFEKVSFRVLHKDDRVLHVVMLETPTKNNNTLTMTRNKQSNPFLDFEDLENDDENSSKNTAALQLPRSLLKQASPTKQPSLNILNEVGDKVQVVVTHIVNPISFYGIIQNDYCSDYKTFSWHDQQISPLQKQLYPPPQLNEIVLSQYVKDDYWYRARVINIDSQKHLYEVFYVDFGNTEVVTLSKLAKCSKEQLKDPLRAVLFRLSNLSIVMMADEHDASNSYSIKTRLKSAIANMVVMILDQILNVEIVQRINNDLVVRLIDTQYADIPKILVDMGIVEEI
ncbi:uncharacterized protein LOC119600417 [Lucilia sericata]|uniref:uncharacterized protein LOC119600417 n=1 Tax=Lucilia sericata TaxID=13632 RepID=UPI0018A86CE2|nr:uncharacterized protein LOC119600417 [Lucilia sericata]